MLKIEQEVVPSLLDKMEDGNEYGSIVSVSPAQGQEIFDEIDKGLKEIEAATGRPCLCYTGNVVRAGDGESGIDSTDDLPFTEMLKQVPEGTASVDIFLVTNGGSGHQVNRFVNSLRARFDVVNFLIPSFCMSAGTLFALSGNKIYMTDNACLGPIDPQVPTKDGRFVPAQALLLLVEELQRQGQDAINKGGSVPWSIVRIIDGIDKKELGEAMTSSQYSTMMATEFLKLYKFKDWSIKKTSREAVTPEYKEQRANEIALALVSHDRWKSHGHAISREVLWNEIRLEIDHPDADLERAIVRLWALFTWIYDKTPILKMITSSNYRYCKHKNKT